MSIFSDRLKELRGTESQASFAAAIGVNRVQYAKYEGGQNSPSVDILNRICRVMSGVSADWLLGLDTRTIEKSAVQSRNRASKAAPGEHPDCAKCPYKKKLEEVEAFFAAARKKKRKS